MKIKFLQAFNGDSILISFKDRTGKVRNILVDGGTAFTYRDPKDRIMLKPKSGDLKLIVETLKQADQKIDLLVLTHVDYDHIGGILKWFSEDPAAKDLVGKVWFNSGKLISEYFKAETFKENLVFLDEDNGNEDNGKYTGISQGVSFEGYIEKHEIWDRRIIKSFDEINVSDVKFTILSPDEKRLKRLLKKWEKEQPDSLEETGGFNDYHLSLKEHIKRDVFKEDPSIHNGSSIAFILDFYSKKILLLGDAHPTPIVNSLKHLGYSEEKPLKVDLVKVSHHGSKANTTYELLEMIDCNKFVISSNGSGHNLPDKQCLARIINSRKNVCLYFNYPDRINQIFSDQDFIDYNEFQALPVEREFEL